MTGTATANLNAADANNDSSLEKPLLLCRRSLATRAKQELTPADHDSLRASVDSSEGALSRGRGFMGAEMLDDPGVMVFGGGIGKGGTVVEARADVFAGVEDDAERGATATREVLS